MPAQVSGNVVQIGEWVVHPALDSISRGTETQKLEPRAMRLLMCLANSPGEVVSIDRLLTEVWAGVVVGPASVYETVSQLRKSLGDVDPKPTYIATVPRKGYRLVAPVRRPKEAFSPPAETGKPSSPWIPVKSHRLRWIGGTAAAVIVIAAAIFLSTRKSSEVAVTSIAVMPFVDLTVGKTEQPFCDGVTEELSNWLTQIPTLRVVARRSASAFRDKQIDVREIGRLLGTANVLEGSLRRSGNLFRVSVQLIATKDGYSVWSGTYESPVTDVIKVQEQVARAVASSLELRLTDATSKKFADRQSASGEAYSLYLIARHHQYQRTRQDNEQAIELYKQAIATDPNFALAKIGLAYAYINQRYFNDRPIESIKQDAELLLASAASTSPELADLYVVRGALETELLQQDAAVRDLHRAVALNPNSRDALAELGFHYLVNGEPREALQNYTHAAELDPLDYNLHAQRCIALSDLARFADGAAACEKARALEPGAAWAYSASSVLEEAQGHISAALTWNAAALARSTDVQAIYAERGILLLGLGLVDQARKTYDTAIAATASVDSNVYLTWLGLVTTYAHAGAAAMHKLMVAGGWDATKDPEWLFELADAALMTGDAPGARAFTDRALTSPDLKPNDLASPWFARTGYSNLLIAAAAEQATGDSKAATLKLTQLSTLLDRLTAAGMRRYGIYELQAQIAALRGDAETAMVALQHAVDLGWRQEWLAEHQPYFASLRSRADFHNLLDRIRRKNAEESAKIDFDASLAAAPHP